MRKYVVLVFCVIWLFSGVLHAHDAVPYDLGGRTVRIQTQFADLTPLGMRGEYNWYDPDPRLQAHIESVEEMLNCSIEFVYQGSNRDALARMHEAALAGERPFDVTHTGSRLVDAAMAGLLLPLNDVKEPGFYDRYPPSFQYSDLSGFKVGGSIYGFEGLNWRRSTGVVFWNMDMFEEHGWPSLHELYLEDEWTYQAFEEIAYQATMDTTGDGQINQFGLSGTASHILERYGPGSNDARLTRIVDGRTVSTIDEDPLIEWWSLIGRLNAANAAVYSPASTDFNWAMLIQSVSWFESHQDTIDNLGLNIGMVPLPKGPNAVDYAFPEAGQWTAVIPIWVDNPRDVMEVVKALWMLSEPYADLDEWEQHYWWTRGALLPDRESFDVWQKSYRDAYAQLTQFERRVLVNEVDGWSAFLSDMSASGDVAIVSRAAQLKPAHQRVLDDILGQ